MRIDPNDATAYNSRGVVYALKEAYDPAIADYTAALRINPNIVSAYYNRGNAYYNKNNLDRAIADYEAVLRINPNNADAKRMLATAREERGY